MNHPNGACTLGPGCGFPINLNKTEHGFRSRYNITYHITPDIMTYATYSQGFRPGGFNRTDSQPGMPPSLTAEAPFYPSSNPLSSGSKQYDKPAGFGSDKLINMEIGSKAELLDRRLIVNLSGYVMHWSNVQYVFFDPVHLGNTTFDVNGPSYTIRGGELQVAARVTEGLTVQDSGSWNSSEQTNAPCLESNVVSAGNPTPVGTCIHTIKGLPYTNPYGVLGTRAPFSPAQEWNIRARYDFSINDYKPFVWAGANHIGSMANQPANYPPPTNPPTTTLSYFTMPSYTTYDAGAGVAKDWWTVQVVAEQSLELEREPVHLDWSVHRVPGSAAAAHRDVPGEYEVRRRNARGSHASPGGAAPAARGGRTAASPTTAAAPAPPAAACGPGGSAPRRDLRDGLGEAPPGIGLDSGRCRRENRALPLLARRRSRVHRFDGLGCVQPEAVRAARGRREGLPRGAWCAHGCPKRGRVRQRESDRQQRYQGGTRRQSPGNRAIYGSSPAVTA